MAVAWITEVDLDDATSVDAKEAARAASLLMYQLSGRKYSGVHEITEFYERPAECTGYNMNRIIQAARDRNDGVGCLTHRRGRLRLRSQPVRAVYELVVGFETERRIVDPAEYQVVDRAYVRPVVGASWTPCSNVEVTYQAGASVPEAGLRAARVLGNELLKARCNAEDCRLPDRVTSISRQGVSFTVLDAQDFLKDGRTGLYEVDLFLKAANPNNARKRAGVFTPDLPRAGRVTYS